MRSITLSALPTTYNEQDKSWSGEQHIEIYDHDASVGKIIFNTMKNWPNNVCQINDDDGVSVTYAQAITWAIRIAQHLRSQGFDHQDVIGIVAGNSTYLMPLAVGCLLNGTPFHAVSPLQGEESIKYIFEITQPKLIFCDGPDFEMIQLATKDWRPQIYTLGSPIRGIPKIEDLLDATTTEFFYEPTALKTGGDQTVAILCSSGTTGLPKAICFSKNILTQRFMPVTSESVFFSASALDWITGLWAFSCSTIVGCTRVITGRPFSAAHLVQLVRKYKISSALLPPRYLTALVQSPEATADSLSSLRLLFYGGGSTSLDTLQRAQQICTNAVFNSLYGMTELGAVTSDLGLEHNNAAGRVLPGRKIRIVDEEGGYLGYNQIGEIYVYTEEAWNGYYGNPVETRSFQDSQGWFHTGDLGYFNEENILYVVGRKKETLKYHRLHYCPPEIESVIAELPQVREVCVVGIYNELHGDEAGALIVRREGYDISAKEVIDHVSKRLTGMQKQLHAGVQFTNQLPTNVNSKVIRNAAREIFVSQKESNK